MLSASFVGRRHSIPSVLQDPDARYKSATKINFIALTKKKIKTIESHISSFIYVFSHKDTDIANGDLRITLNYFFIVILPRAGTVWQVVSMRVPGGLPPLSCRLSVRCQNVNTDVREKSNNSPPHSQITLRYINT